MLHSDNNKALIVVLGLCFFTSYLFSQTVYSNKESSSFGFTAGLTSSDIYKDTINYEQGISLNGGFAFTFAVSDKSNIGVELLLTGKTVKRSNPIIKYRFSYIDIPVYFQRKLSENIKLDLGVQYSTLVKAKYYILEGSHAGGVLDQPLATKMTNDIGVLAGVELGILKNLFVAGRYTYFVNSIIQPESPCWGVFQFSLKCVVFRGHKQLFNKKGKSE